MKLKKIVTYYSRSDLIENFEYLVWDFVQEDGQGGDLSDALSGDEGSPDGQTVGEVVERVGEQV